MKTEIEVKFINIDIDAMRQKLKNAGAQLEQPMRLMRRVLVDLPEMGLGNPLPHQMSKKEM